MLYQRSISYTFLVFDIFIGLEVFDASYVGHLISINIEDINVISNLTYCSVKTINLTETADQKSENFTVKASFVKPK